MTGVREKSRRKPAAKQSTDPGVLEAKRAQEWMRLDPLRIVAAKNTVAHAGWPNIDVNKLELEEAKDLLDIASTIVRVAYSPEEVAAHEVAIKATKAQAEKAAETLRAAPTTPVMTEGLKTLLADVTLRNAKTPSREEFRKVRNLYASNPEVTVENLVSTMQFEPANTYWQRPPTVIDPGALSASDRARMDQIHERNTGLEPGTHDERRARAKVQAEIEAMAPVFDPPKRRRYLESPGMVRVPAEVYTDLAYYERGEDWEKFKLAEDDVMFLIMVMGVIENRNPVPGCHLDGDTLVCPAGGIAWRRNHDHDRAWPLNPMSFNHPIKNLMDQGWLKKDGDNQTWRLSYGDRLLQLLGEEQG